MLTRWLTFTAFLAAIVHGFVTVTPTRRIKGHPEVELTLNCGDGNKAGVVEYWHTPFGDFHTPSFHSELDPVFMHHDGSLVIPNSSRLHSGLYYCLQRQTEGTTLWPYELHVGPDNKKNQEHGGYKEGGGSSDALRFRRDVRSEEEEQAVVSDEVFAGAVAASVLLTFVLGFSAGALSRTHVLRCLGTVTKRLQSPRQQQCQTDMPEHGYEVTMTTLPSSYGIQASPMEQVWDHDSQHYEDVETTVSSVTSSPPPKPQRSFRHKRQEEQETVPPDDDMKEEENRLEEEEEEEEENKGCDEEDDCYRLGEDRGSETETEEDKCSDDGEEKGGRKESTEEKEEQRREEEVEEAGEQVVSRSKERRSSEEEEEAARGNEENRRDEKMEEEKEEEEGGDDGGKRRSEEEEETDINRDSEQSSSEAEDDETGRKNQEEKMENGIKGGGGGGEPSSSLSRPGRRSRVIRLYQYNEDGQRYGHLPDPAPGDTGPAPRLKQRTVSLTRLSAIMAAASAGPLDASQNKRETEKEEEEEREERPRFHMEI